MRARWQRAALIVGYLVLWQLLDRASDVFGVYTGARPWFPPTALDVLLLIVVGWRWWPMLPLATVIHWLIVDPLNPLAAVSILTHVITGTVYGGIAWFARDGLHLRPLLRSSRDVGLFCTLFVLAGPTITGSLFVVTMMSLGMFGPHEALTHLSRFIVGDAAAIIVIVPATLGLLHWKQLRPPVEHREPLRSELIALVVATVVLIALGYGAATVTPSALLDLSFVPLAWLALRYGLRGSVVGIIAADVTATVIAVALHVTVGTLMQYQAFLIASALVSLLLGSITLERWDLVARLARRAYVDELTGLPNRERLVEWMGANRGSPMVLVMLDIDEMRLLNEGVGRIAADRALQDIAMRLRTGLPSSYFVARVSADEYAVTVVDERSPHAIMAEVRQFFDAPFDVDGGRIFVSVSLGAVFDARASDADEMLRQADVAVHRAKLTPARSVVYSEELQSSGEPLLVGQLHRAAEQGEFVSFFQPIFKFDELHNRWHVVGAESLLRWIHPERGILAPASFIDMLERLTISEHVGWAVVEASLRQALEWRAMIPEFRVWVNLFARQALDDQCARRIADVLDRLQAPPDALVVEINERIVASDERDVAALALALRTIGVNTAIDDFGTGGSSLGRVREVPAGVLKIDRSFVAKSEVDAKAKAVASTVVRLARELGMSVVAEGVENPLQLAVMIETGCEYAQGYALGHPLPADLFQQMYLDVPAAP